MSSFLACWTAKTWQIIVTWKLWEVSAQTDTTWWPFFSFFFCSSLDFAQKVEHLRMPWPFFCSLLEFRWKIGHLRTWWFFFLLFTWFGRKMDVMTFFSALTWFWAENWASADMMTFKKPVLPLRSENMITPFITQYNYPKVLWIKQSIKHRNTFLLIGNLTLTMH